MPVSTNIKRYREAKDLTQEQLAEGLGVARSTVTQWENGWSSPRMGMVQKIAAFFGVSTADIVSDSAQIFTGVMEMAQVPLLGKVHAGKPTEPDEFEGERVDIPKFLVDADPDTYACKAEGDCMNRVYPEGCIIAVSPNRAPQNGSVAVVTIDGRDAVMRRMYKTPDTLVLSPDSFNPDHKDIVITSDDEHTVEFGGKVVWFQASEEME